MAKRKLKYLVIHCTATPEGREVTEQNIIDWHINQRGWSRVGYHYLIQLDGTIINLHPHDDDDWIDNWEITNGAKGYNTVSIHIAYAGGCAAKKMKDAKWYPAKDTRTVCQLEAMEQLVKELVDQHTTIKVLGHNQLSNKSCPSFDVQQWAESIELNPKNFYKNG